MSGSDFVQKLRGMVRQRPFLIILLLAIAVLGVTAVYARYALRNPRNQQFFQWASDQNRADLITVQRDTCPGAPFILPADGFIGLLYSDPRGPYSSLNPHQGIDIFSDTEAGITPVYAAYAGYVTREDGWRSTLIMRLPQDPLQPERQIWLYYTHMADRQGNDFIEPAFAPGTRELFVEQGTLLGYTGNYNGDSARGVWVHLHFSVVQDDGNGRYLNELDINNTLDPSPYLGLSVNYNCTQTVTTCADKPTCA
jgi:murein DD-endopeptidase MepM/ murein hydrolase activator NlpD